LLDEILEIVDDSSGYVDREHIAHSRLRIAARKMVVVRLAPKKYGKH
jgi:hypothetical protein